MFSRRDFLEKTVLLLTATLEQAARADGGESVARAARPCPADAFAMAPTAAPRRWLRRLDPRVKCPAFFGMVAIAASSRHPEISALVFALGAALGLMDGGFGGLAPFFHRQTADAANTAHLVHTLPSSHAVRRSTFAQLVSLWGSVLLFTGLAVLPATVLTPGRAVAHLPWLGWAVTEPGLRSAAGLLARAEAAATWAALLALTTPWPRLLKALRTLRVPVLIVVILGMTYRYLFLLMHLSLAFFEARRARRVGWLSGPQRRAMAVSGAAALLQKSLQLAGEGYDAMVARGFTGEAHTLDEPRLRPADLAALAAFLCAEAPLLFLALR